MSRFIFIDCGTHLGMGFSRLAESLNIDHNWEIYGFEANPYVFDGYVKNIKSEKYPILSDKNINLENKAVWISDEGIEFSLRGITKHHYDTCYNDDWKSDLATMVGEHNGLDVEESLDIPWDGGSCAAKFKDKIKDTPERDELYEWHETIKVESIDLSQWIINNFSKNDHIVLKMDIEGSEYEILKAFDLDNFRPKVFTIEHNHTENNEKLDKLLIAKGYLRVFRKLTTFDAWYISSENLEAD